MTAHIRRPVLAVGATVWNEQGDVLLVRRGKPPRQNEWSIPGGKVEWGETLHQALTREIFEETGLSVEIEAPLETVDSILRDPDGAVVHHHVLVDYSARVTGGVLTPGDDVTEARWVPLAEIAPYALWPETARIIALGAARQK